ncbi:unnamed protein product [Lactuca virosa]|uniref:Uncharacterized protein n=1 Tax=Lactuca virosa TaxID=75947 RepID=A0AAU9LCA3_9ASTR|nr:unnamed protein product [Lactuca virosa]
MNKVRWEHCILKVNIGRYEKQGNPMKMDWNHVKEFTPPPPPIKLASVYAKVWPLRSNRMFEVAVKGMETGNVITHSRRMIALKPIEKVSQWGESVLVGEVCNAQFISSIPTIMERYGNHSVKVYYIGGLKILIVFVNQKEAEAFYVDDSNWNRWFKWLKKVFDEDTGGERITSVKINGVPVRFPSEENYARITENFGKPI